MIRRTLAVTLAAALVFAPASASNATPTPAPGCDVVSADLTWGVKESFRAYVDGSIANGEWTTADGATYETPVFGFAAESGRLDSPGPVGSVAFAGAVRFTGHGGILDTTIANPVLVLRPDGSANLLLDVSGPTMDGDEVSVTAAAFADVDLEGQNLTPVAGVVTIDEAPATLTEDGSAAFPNYEPGAELDPVSATIDVGECELAGRSTGGPALPIALAVGAVLVVVAAAIVALLLVRARRGRR